MSLKETRLLLNETVLCLESAQQLVNLTTLSRWIALTSQNRFIVFDGQNEPAYDNAEYTVQKRESLVQKAISRSRKVTASSDGGDEPPIKALHRSNVEAIGELANNNGNEYSMSSIKSSGSYQEYTNAECEVDVFSRPKFIDVTNGTERLTKNPEIADTDSDIQTCPCLGLKVVCSLVVDKRLTCMVVCNTLVLKRGEQTVKLRGLDIDDWKMRLEMVKRYQ